jgi:hypothetical protein
MTQFVVYERATLWQCLYRLPDPHGQGALQGSGDGARCGGLLPIAAFQLAGARASCTWRPWPVVRTKVISVEPVMALSGRKHP